MSLSDNGNESFEPIALSSLEKFNEEKSNKTEGSDPDFDLFKALFEKPKFEKEACYEFKASYDEKKNRQKIVFTPLIKKKTFEKKGLESKVSQGKEGPETLGETIQEKGYRDGFERGLEQGRDQGRKQGQEDGFKKGFEKGEQQGVEKGEQQGLDLGLKLGEEKATAQIRETAEKTLASLETILETADDMVARLVETYEKRIISLIEQIARKVVMAQVEINDEIIRHMVLDALNTLVQPEKIVLTVSQEDYEYIEMIKEEFFEQIESLHSISVRSDPLVKRGGCKIDTLTASVSTDPESRLDAIFEAMKKAGAV